MEKTFLFLIFFICILTTAPMAKAQDMRSKQMERKLFIMLMDYNIQKNNGALAEETARQKFFDQLEDLWTTSGMQTSVPFSRIESLLTKDFPEAKRGLGQEIQGRIRIKRHSADKITCMEYQDGLLIRELHSGNCL